MTSEVSKVLRLPQKMQDIFWNRGKRSAPAKQNDFWHVMKHVGMSQSATPAMRNEATQRYKLPKVARFAELTISTPIWSSRERSRTVANVADGCGLLRSQRQRPANTAQPPHPQSEMGTLATHSGKIYIYTYIHIYIYIYIHPICNDNINGQQLGSAGLRLASLLVDRASPRQEALAACGAQQQIMGLWNHIHRCLNMGNLRNILEIKGTYGKFPVKWDNHNS